MTASPPRYSRGVPSPFVRQLGNPYVTAAPLRAALYHHLGLRPEQVMLVLAGKHWGAIKTYVKTERLATEPIRERLKDMANYMALMAVMLEGKQ